MCDSIQLHVITDQKGDIQYYLTQEIWMGGESGGRKIFFCLRQYIMLKFFRTTYWKLHHLHQNVNKKWLWFVQEQATCMQMQT